MAGYQAGFTSEGRGLDVDNAKPNKAISGTPVSRYDPFVAFPVPLWWAKYLELAESDLPS